MWPRIFIVIVTYRNILLYRCRNIKQNLSKKQKNEKNRVNGSIFKKNKEKHINDNDLYVAFFPMNDIICTVFSTHRQRVLTNRTTERKDRS